MFIVKSHRFVRSLSSAQRYDEPMMPERPEINGPKRWRIGPVRIGIMAAAGCLAISMLMMPLMLIAGPGLGDKKTEAGRGDTAHAIASGSERFDDLAVMIVGAPLLYAVGGFVFGLIAGHAITLHARSRGGIRIDIS